jgi:hypothetical protein
MDLRAQIEPSTVIVIVGDPNTPMSSMDRSSRQRINKETSELLHSLDQIDMEISTEYFTQQLGNTH